LKAAHRACPRHEGTVPAASLAFSAGGNCDIIWAHDFFSFPSIWQSAARTAIPAKTKENLSMKNIFLAVTFSLGLATLPAFLHSTFSIAWAQAGAVSGQAAPADPNQLSPEEIQRAIRGEGKDHWIEIEDMGLTAANGSGTPRILLFMPEAVLASQSESAKKQFLTYEPTSEEKRRSLMISAHGFVGKTAREGCASVTRVILLSDPSGGVVKEAYLSEPLNETRQNGVRAAHCQALRTKFTLDDVQKVKAAAPDGEFLVAVFSGTVNTMYKIKKKHQAKLALS
jgi:hypothetical protein